MRHRRRVKHFSRKTTALKELFRGLIVSLVEHGRIKTTVEKAKELRRHVEPAITLGKKNNLASRRLLLSRLNNQSAVNAIMTDLSPRFKDRAGGYTRIIKIGRRPGDTAEMAFIEFVDYDWEKVSDQGKKAKTSDAKSTEAKKAKAKLPKEEKEAKKASKEAVIAKKSASKTQKRTRVAAKV